MTAAQVHHLATNPDHYRAQKTNAEASTNHLEEFEVGCYRGIGKLNIMNINKMNLIVGGNAIGKTSLLEAIWLFYNRGNPGTLWRTDLSRSGYEYADPTTELGREGKISMRGVQNGNNHSYSATFETFHARQSTGRRNSSNSDELRVAGRLGIVIDGESKGTEPAEQFMTQKGLVILPKLDENETPSKLLLHDSFLKRDVDGFSKIIKQGQKKSLIERLRLISPLLRDADIIVEEDGNPYVLVMTEAGECLKLEDMGSGVVKLFDCLVAIYASQNGIVCIDEIESGLHHTLLSKFWDTIRLLSEELNVQIFAATHSRECITAAIEAYKERPTDLKIYAMYYNENAGHIKSVSYSGDELDAINSMDVEVR